MAIVSQEEQFGRGVAFEDYLLKLEIQILQEIVQEKTKRSLRLLACVGKILLVDREIPKNETYLDTK